MRVGYRDQCSTPLGFAIRQVPRLEADIHVSLYDVLLNASNVASAAHDSAAEGGARMLLHKPHIATSRWNRNASEDN
jgi:hypothetical protein